MVPSNLVIWLYLVFFLVLLNQIHGKPAFWIILDCMNCTVNPAYANPPNCSLDTNYDPPRGYIDIQMHREVKIMQYEFILSMTLNKRTRTLLHLKNQDQCAYFDGTASNLIKMIKVILEDFGTFPKKCPVDKNFRYLFKDITIDTNKLPPFMVAGNFEIFTRMTTGKELIYDVTTRGKISRNYDNRNKGKVAKV